MLSSLNDCKFFPKGDEVEIWYCKAEYFSSFNFDDISNFNPKNLAKTHTKLGSLAMDPSHKTDMLDRLFFDLQGERWSYNGEANKLIKELKLSHTSMSVGDVVRFKAGETYLCKNIGWEQH